MKNGFTLVEIMVGLSVAGILLTVGVPSFRSVIQDNRLVTQNNELVVAVNMAKNEAVKRGMVVTLCRSSDSASCTGNWQDGWIVFNDVDGDGVVDAGDGDTVLRVHGPLDGGNTLSFSGAGNRVQYNSRGIAVSATGTFKLCDSRGATSARGLIVSTAGRPRVAEDTNADGTREDGTGTNFTCP